MKVINIKDFCIPAQDADYDELSNFADEIAELATYPIEAEPVRRGHWIGIDDFPHDVWECDMCGYVYEDTPPLHHYCPNCGAQMEEQK